VGNPVCRRGWWDWEGFVEQVSFKSGMEERGSDGMKPSRKIIPKTG